MDKWDLFKKEFEESGASTHTEHFQVDWTEKDGALKGVIRGLNQELTHNVEFVIEHNEYFDRFDCPKSYQVTWTSRDIMSGEIRHEGDVIVSTAFLAATAIHYDG